MITTHRTPTGSVRAWLHDHDDHLTTLRTATLGAHRCLVIDPAYRSVVLTREQAGELARVLMGFCESGELGGNGERAETTDAK
jgi:hypothetical protein